MSKKVSQHSDNNNHNLDEVLFKSSGYEPSVNQDEFSSINSNVQISPKNLDKLAVLQNATGNYTIQDNEVIEFKEVEEKTLSSDDSEQDLSSIIDAHEYSIDMNLTDTKVNGNQFDVSNSGNELGNDNAKDFDNEDYIGADTDLFSLDENVAFQEQVNENNSSNESDSAFYDAGFVNADNTDVTGSNGIGANEDLSSSSDISSSSTTSVDTGGGGKSKTTDSSLTDVVKLNPHGDIVGNSNGNGNGKGSSKKQDTTDDQLAINDGSTTSSTDPTTDQVIDTTTDTLANTGDLLDSGSDDSGSILI